MKFAPSARPVLAVLSLAGLAAALALPLAPRASASNPKTIYGNDDRLDQYQVSDPALLAIGSATTMLVNRTSLTSQGDTYVMNGRTYNDYIRNSYGKPLCPNVPFANQPAPGECSGFLVAPDIIATAGHCLESGCRDWVYVFGFVATGPDSAPVAIPKSQVYFCKGIVGRQLDEAAGLDWGLVQLDRPVANVTPLPVRTEGTVPGDAQLVMAGYPFGLPLKYVPNIALLDNGPAAYFEANPDALGGNSGSAVVNQQTGVVEGILVAGNDDYVEERSCVNEYQCPDSGCPDGLGAEQVSRATLWSGLLAGGPLPPGATADPTAGGDISASNPGIPEASASATGVSPCGPLGCGPSPLAFAVIALGLWVIRPRRR